MIKKPYYTIVHIDGGISSQMWQYVVGYILKLKGRDVLYDLSWFSEYGLDMNGENRRVYCLEKLFPYLHVNKCDYKQMKNYKRFARYAPNDMTKFIGIKEVNVPDSPIFLDDYYFPKKEAYSLYKSLFHIAIDEIEDFDDNNQRIAEQIKKDKYSVGVHVRRGDMANTNGYWDVLNEQYFIEAIKLFDRNKNTFYFFSEDMKWVMDNIITKSNIIKYVLVDINDSTRGHCDLALLSLCKHQVISQGSFGPMASLLNKNPDKEVVMPYKDGGFKYHPDWCSWEEVLDAKIRYVKKQKLDNK